MNCKYIKNQSILTVLIMLRLFPVLLVIKSLYLQDYLILLVGVYVVNKICNNYFSFTYWVGMETL